MNVEFSTLSLRKRLLALIMLITFCFIALFIRLFVVQGINSTNLQIKAVEQWVRKLPLTAKRGEIKDVNGQVLTYNTTSYDVYVRSKEVENAFETAEFLSNNLSLDFKSVYEKIKRKNVSEVLLKLQVNEDIAKKILEKDLSGVFVSENIKRNYNCGNLLSQVLGYITSDARGQTGVEAYYNKLLEGVDGRYLTQNDVKGIELNESLNYYIEPQDGFSLTLNIDINIQRFVENILCEIIQEHKPQKATITVMNPQNGEVVAMGIAPTFDLDDIPREDVSKLMELSKNSIVSDVYEPGSTFKILTLAAALSENLVKIDDRFFCPGFRIIDGERIKCWRTIGHGSQTLVEGVQNSCNCVFMDLALKLGKEKLYKYLMEFGIGAKTGIDIAGESGGILMNIENVQTVDLVRIGFGQAVAVSQIQLLSAFSAAVNGGLLFQPVLLNKVEDFDGNLIKQNKSIKTGSAISENVSKTICYLLEESVNKAGKNTFVAGYSVGGKTGTAQKYENGAIANGKYVSSFFGVYPTEKPQYVMLVCVDEPSAGVYYGSVVAKPYGQKLFEKIIEYKGFLPESSEIYSQTIINENYVGKSLNEAILLIEKLGLSYEIDGEGSVVVGQYPNSKVVLNRNSTVILKT